MKRKIIQIVDIIANEYQLGGVMVLCDDGSVWTKFKNLSLEEMKLEIPDSAPLEIERPEPLPVSS